MAAAIGLRSDFKGAVLRKLARASDDARQVRRLLALATIYDGGTRSEAARIGGVTLQIVRDWVVRFNAEGPDGLIDHKAPGTSPLLDEEHRRAFANIVEDGPIPQAHGVARGRLPDLAPGAWDELPISIRRQPLSRDLSGHGLRKHKPKNP